MIGTYWYRKDGIFRVKCICEYCSSKKVSIYQLVRKECDDDDVFICVSEKKLVNDYTPIIEKEIKELEWI